MPIHHIHPDGGLSRFPHGGADPEDLIPVVSPKAPRKRKAQPKKDEPVAEQPDSPTVD